MLDLFEDSNKIFESSWSLLPWCMVKNERFEIAFHLKKTKDEMFNRDGSVNNVIFRENFDEFMQRLRQP